MLALDRRVDFDPAHHDQFFAALPNQSAAVLVEPRADLVGARPFLLRPADLKRRLRVLFSPAEVGSKRIDLSGFAAAVCFRVTGSPFEQALAYLQQSCSIWPRHYRERMRL